MGKYTTPTDLKKLYRAIDKANLTNDDIEFFIRKAEAEVDSKIVTAYSLPFSVTPELIRQVTAELALIRILDRFFTSEDASQNDWRDIRKKEVDATLAGLADGSVTLVSSDGSIIGQRTDFSITSTTEDYTPIFGHGDVINEIVDTDLIEDEDDERGC